MDAAALMQFADNYTSVDFNKIKFDWNGKHGNDFHDNNIEFRIQLTEFLIPKLNTVRLELIRDIYLEEGKASEETFGVYKNFNLLAQELLQGLHVIVAFIRLFCLLLFLLAVLHGRGNQQKPKLWEGFRGCN